MSKKKKKLIATPKTLHSDLKACKTAFDSVEIPWVIMGGIVLGYARYNDIMSWDTDIDIGVFVELTKDQWRKLYNSLHNNKFRIGNNKKDFICGRRESSFNLQLYHKNGNFYESFPQTMKGFKYVEKIEWYDKPQMTKFLDDYYPMPNHINKWVACHYGKDWKTHIIKDHSEYFREKRGIPSDWKSWILNRKRKDGNLWWPALLKINENIGDFKDEI